MRKTCDECGAAIDRLRFCSIRCKSSWHYKNRVLKPNVCGNCVVCGKWFERYVSPSRKKTHYCTNDTCGRTCAGKRRSGSNHPAWKGGTKVDRDGYILQWSPDHPNAVRGYVRKHRLVMEKRLGRYLEKAEVVHHIDGDVKNNNIKNLFLYSSNAQHKREDYKERKIDSKGRFIKKGKK